jgi:hypothetical protein
MAYATGLVKITDTFAPMIERQLTANGVHMDQYSKQCVINAIGAINTVLDSKGIDWNDPQLDRNNVTQILMNVAALKLNAAASPREVFFQLRNVKVGENWKKQIEMGIEGDGNDAILARFGRNVKQVRPFWLVREHDHFEYPSYNGLEMTPPKWTPTGKGEVVRVVYPIIFQDDSIQFFIAEREDVAKNLIAHIANNLMNETFNICKDRFNATPEQKKQIAEKKKAILDKAKSLGLDALDDPELQKWISPAWTEYQSREAMLIRKMRNNIVKKIPKDFGSAFVEMIHAEATDPEYAEIRREIEANANSEPIDVEYKVQPGPDEQPAPQSDAQTQQQTEPQQTPDPAVQQQPAGTSFDGSQGELDFGDYAGDPVAAGAGPDF